MVKKRHARSLVAMILALAGSALANGASATQTCQGSYITALFQPLPAQVVVGLDVHDRSPRNLDLGKRFLAGVSRSAVAVGEQPNVTLHVSTSRIGQISAQPDRGAVPDYSEFSGLQGGMQPAMPAMPSNGLLAPRLPPKPPLMFVRVDASVGNSTTVAWVATVQCQMAGTDEGQFAEDLGRLVGSTLGKRTERQPF